MNWFHTRHSTENQKFKRKQANQFRKTLRIKPVVGSVGNPEGEIPCRNSIFRPDRNKKKKKPLTSPPTHSDSEVAARHSLMVAGLDPGGFCGLAGGGVGVTATEHKVDDENMAALVASNKQPPVDDGLAPPLQGLLKITCPDPRQVRFSAKW
jgi:hypothetical protein